MQVTLDRPWLSADLGSDHRILSWAVHRPGLVTARHLLWREVRNADLPVGLDVTEWLTGEVDRHGVGDAVVMLTSRDIRAHHHARSEVAGIAVDCLATVGLSNAERIGTRQPAEGRNWGTINIGVQVHAGLTLPAMVEAMTIVAEARTTAIIDHGLPLPDGPATGTGTDCIALAAREGDCAYAGLHTPLGEALGCAVYSAVAEGAAEWARWIAEQRQSR